MKDAQFFFLQLLIQLLNTVVIPGLVVLVVSSDCFHYALVSPRVITATYAYETVNCLPRALAASSLTTASPSRRSTRHSRTATSAARA